MLEAIKDLFVYYDIFDFSGFVLSNNVIFMLALAFVWIIFAVIEDFKRREVENWWNFSLIAIILAFRAFWSISDWNYLPILWGVIGLVAGFILANAFYYGRIFAGGDAKLLMALGTILPLSLDWKINLGLFLLFILFLIFSGAIYGLVYSFVLTFIKFKAIKQEIKIGFKEYKKAFYLSLFIGIIFALVMLYFKAYLLLILAFILIISPLLYIYASAIEKTCLDKLVKVKDLTIGDWLVKSVKVGKKIIKPNWEGLSEIELRYLQKHYKGKILVKYGIPFTPAFLIALILLILFLL